MKSRVLILLFAFVSVCIVCNRDEYRGNIYYLDTAGYYRYLPAVFIYHDLGNMQFQNSEHSIIFDLDAIFLPGQKATGFKTDKYPIGTSLFELPEFLVAYAYCSISHTYPNDGFSIPYQVAGVFSAILWVVLGLFVLRKLLLTYFNDGVACLVLLCLAFGTNLYYYTAFAQGLSHGYSFFLFAAILYQSVAFYRSGRPVHMYWIGLLLGLVIITRPVNMVIALIPLLWGVYNMQSLKDRVKLLGTRVKDILIAFLLFLAVAFIQMAYWKYTSGHWIYYSYTNERFDFLHPNIWKGLFSYRKGWFVYTPIAFIGMLGLYPLWKMKRELLPVLVLYFIIIIYLVFCWQNWWYGGGFGCRPMIESLAILSLPLGALINAVLSNKRIILTILSGSALCFCLILNLFQSYQFSLHIIHHDRMSKAYYWHVFGKTKIDFAESEQYLLDEKEYWQINRSINN